MRVWSVQVCFSTCWSCGVSVWAANDCWCHLCFRCSQLISAGVFVCIKASYSRFVCKVAGVFVCFAEGMDEKTAIFQARRRWHTWPVKHTLHLTVQLLPRLWAWRLAHTEMLSQSKKEEIHQMVHKDMQQLFSAYWSAHEFINYTHTLYTEYEVCCWWRAEDWRTESLVVLHRMTATQYSEMRISEICPSWWIMIAACSGSWGSLDSPVGRFYFEFASRWVKSMKRSKTDSNYCSYSVRVKKRHFLDISCIKLDSVNKTRIKEVAFKSIIQTLGHAIKVCTLDLISFKPQNSSWQKCPINN